MQSQCRFSTGCGCAFTCDAPLHDLCLSAKDDLVEFTDDRYVGWALQKTQIPTTDLTLLNQIHNHLLTSGPRHW